MLPTGVYLASYSVTIHFKSGHQLVLDKSTEVVGPNYIDSIRLHSTLAGTNKNPVGVLAANTLSLELTSKDLSLDPTNKSSPFYGDMNSSAWVQIHLVLEDDTQLNMGIYYVDTWQPNITNSTPFSISIECVDLLSIICKMKVPQVSITFGMTLAQYLARLFDKINEQLDSQYRINYDVSTMTFGLWSEFNYQQLNTTNMGDMLNTISQCTLTNLYIDQDNFFRTDYICDDTPADIVMTILADTDTYQASLAPSTNITYNGVQVSYIPNDEDAESSLATLNNIEIAPGDTELKDISIGGKAFSITSISITGDNVTQVYVSLIQYDKDAIHLTIHSDEDVTKMTSIEIQGIQAKSDSLVYNGQDRSSVLEMKNTILGKRDIASFTAKLKQLIELKEKSISLTGIYNPRLRIGDLISVNIAGDFNTSGIYKLNDIDLSLASGGLGYKIELMPSLVVQTGGI